MLSYTEFHANVNQTFPVYCDGSTSPRANAQLPYLLTRTYKSNEKPLSSSEGFPSLALPILNSTSFTTAQTQALHFIQQRVSAAAQPVMEKSDHERDRKKEKKIPNNCCCNSLWNFGKNDRDDCSSISILQAEK